MQKSRPKFRHPYRQQSRYNTAKRDHVYDSIGPAGKLRGLAQQLVDKYTTLAEDAIATGDPVKVERLFQYAEHYRRIGAARSETAFAETSSSDKNEMSHAENTSAKPEEDQNSYPCSQDERGQQEAFFSKTPSQAKPPLRPRTHSSSSRTRFPRAASLTKNVKKSTSSEEHPLLLSPSPQPSTPTPLKNDTESS